MFRLTNNIIKQVIDLLVFLSKGGSAAARRKGVKVGENCRIYIRSFGTEPFLITIGSRVTITSGCRLLTHDGSTWLIRDENGVRYQKYLGVEIGNDVFIGVNTIVLPGVTIGSRVVIGAGSVVTKSIPDNSIAVGNPARVIGTFDDFDADVRRTCVHDSELQDQSSYEDRVHRAVSLYETRRQGTKKG